MGLNLKMFTSGSCSQTFISVLLCLYNFIVLGGCLKLLSPVTVLRLLETYAVRFEIILSNIHFVPVGCTQFSSIR
jgi:hypothetical protein